MYSFFERPILVNIWDVTQLGMVIFNSFVIFT